MGTVQLIPDSVAIPVLANRKTGLSISGTLMVGGSVASRTVVCLSGDGSFLLATTVSAANGTYSFPDLSFDTPLLIIVPGVGSEEPVIHRVIPGP